MACLLPGVRHTVHFEARLVEQRDDSSLVRERQRVLDTHGPCRAGAELSGERQLLLLRVDQRPTIRLTVCGAVFNNVTISTSGDDVELTSAATMRTTPSGSCVLGGAVIACPVLSSVCQLCNWNFRNTAVHSCWSGDTIDLLVQIVVEA